MAWLADTFSVSDHSMTLHCDHSMTIVSHDNFNVCAWHAFYIYIT